MAITDRLPSSTYYDKNYRQTAALIRARRQYLVRNIFTGIGLFGFAIGVYAYTIKAISQDDFSDVVPPPLEAVNAQPAHTPNAAIDRAADTMVLEGRRQAAVDREVASKDTERRSWLPSWFR